MRSWTKPTADQIAAAVDWLSAPHHERYFFDKLDNPLWIEPLRTQGLFKDPPSPEQVGGGIRCRAWPQSQYLARTASLAPDEVASLLVELETKNWLVVRDMIDAAQALPTARVLPLVKKLGDAVRSHRLWHQLEPIGAIASRIARDGKPADALNLVQRAFGGVMESEGSQLRHAGHPFFEVLGGDLVPMLAKALPLDLVTLLLGWMRASMTSEHGLRRGGDDFSYIWRPAIEEHEANRDHDFSAQLVGSLRDVTERAIREGGASLTNVVEILKKDGLLVGLRLAIHLITEFADCDASLAKATMLDRAFFDNYRVKHEYARLLGSRFGMLDPEQQEKWLSWVDAGPPPDESAEPEREERRVEYWKFTRFHWVHGHLTGERRDFYKRILEKDGVPELVDFNVRFGGAVAAGDESPFTIDQMVEMGFEAVQTTARSWRSEAGRRRFDGPSVEGFANVFQQYIATDTIRMSESAMLLEGASAPFVRAFMRAMTEGIKRGDIIQLAPVLDLCGWVLSRPVAERTSPPEEPSPLLDPNWQWCREAISELVNAACAMNDSEERPRFGIELRAALWAALTKLLADDATSNVVNDREGADPRLTDWTLLAINSPRGKAMAALWSYSDWLAGHLDPDRLLHSSFPGGLAHMKEVRSALEEQLLSNEAGFTGRAGFGFRLGLLHWLDANWLRKNAGAIFDLRAIESDPQHAYGWAAWNTFLFSSRPHAEFYKALHDQFSYAVDQAAQLSELGDSREGPFFHLGQHLVALYGRGDLGADAKAAWEADNGIIQRFVTQSHVAVRTYAMEFVGISLQDADDKLPQDVKDRFVGLWERYWASVGAADAGDDPGSAVFGWWFSSSVFDPAWSIEQLEAFVEHCPKAEPDHMIVERLAEIAMTDPKRSARIIDLLVIGDDEGWRVSGWADDAKKVLRIALDAGGDAQNTAEEVIDRLGKRGRVDFGALLAR